MNNRSSFREDDAPLALRGETSSNGRQGAKNSNPPSERESGTATPAPQADELMFRTQTAVGKILRSHCSHVAGAEETLVKASKDIITALEPPSEEVEDIQVIKGILMSLDLPLLDREALGPIALAIASEIKRYNLRVRCQY